MNNRVTQYFRNMPKHTAIIGAFLAGIIVAGIVFWVSRSNPKADDNLAPRAARIERVDGSVGISRVEPEVEKDVAETEWEEASRNAPLAAGDRVYAREGSRATVAFTGRNYARLDSGSALDVLSLDDDRTQLALRNGSAIFDIGELADEELFEVATPNGAFDFNEPGLYQLGIGDDGNAWISVLSGLAQVVGQGGYGQISKGEMLTLVGQAATQVVLAKLSPDYAGGIVDDYYGYRYPDSYDGRYSDYEAYQEDPDYYDPYERSASYRYVADDIPGIYDLDDYGDWSDIDGYGHCWTPRVESDWVPYRDGYWDVGSAYGPTWISQEPWGWAPYHYGRWAYVNNRQWCWVPDRVDRRSVYAPALVAFVPITRSQQIGWVPLAPGEQYVPRYYNADYQPHYFGSPQVVAEVVNVQQTYVNYNYPQAITVVPVQDFTRRFESRRLAAVNPQYIAQTQPVLDPYAIESVRNVAIAGESDRPKFKMARAFRNEVLNTPVVTSVEPVALPGRASVKEAFQVATVSEKQRKNKMRVQDSGQVITADAPNVVARGSMPQTDPSVATQERDQQVAALAARSAQGDKAARRELKRLAHQQNSQPQVGQNPAVGQAPIEGRKFKQMNNQVGVEAVQNPRKAQRQLDRQQMNSVEQQRTQMNQQAQEQQTRAQRKALKRAGEQGSVTLQPQQTKQQMKQQRRQEQVNQPPAQEQVNQQRQLQKQQMRQQRQMQAQQIQNAQVEQRRAQKQVARDPQVHQQRQMKQQMRQQRQLQEQQLQQQRAQQQVNQQRQMKQQQRQAQMIQQRAPEQVNQQRQLQKQQMRQQRQMQAQQTQQRQIQEQQMNQQRVQRQMQKQQMRQQQQMQQQRQPANPPAAVPQIDRQQRKAERRAMQQQAHPQVAQPQQQQPNKSVQYQGPPVNNAATSQAQRRAEKAQRKAGKGNQ
jgi:hypothetical protein